jgi:O-antigen/teichoic acid export membrane protein
MGGGTHITALYALKLAKTVLVTRLVGGFMNLILDIILIPLYGAMGAILATGFAMLATVILEITYIKKFLHQTYPYVFVFKVGGAIIASLLVLRIFPAETIFSLFGVGMAYILVLGTILFFMKPLNHEDKEILKHSDTPALKWLSNFYA